MNESSSPLPPSRDRLRREIDEELRFDLDMRIAELVTSGMTRRAAEQLANSEFGDVDATREYCLEQDELRMKAINRATYLQELQQDLRQALRTLWRSPGLAFVAIVTLALGIGANSAMFSIVNAYLLRALPFPEADRVLRIYGSETERPTASGQLAAADFVDYKRRQSTFAQLGAFAGGGGIYVGQGSPQALSAARVDANVFPILGARALIGRGFTAADSASDPLSMIVLAHSTWQRLFAGDSTIVGSQIDINGVNRTVIGVMPESFFVPTMSGAEYFQLLDLGPVLKDVNRSRKFHFLGMVGRLREGATVSTGRADLISIASALAIEYPESNAKKSVRVVSLREAVTGDVAPSLLIVFGASMILLLIAGVNIAGVLLTRAVGRQHELAVRAALGAGRARLVRQLLTESAVLALAGGAIGLITAVWGTQAFIRIAGTVLPLNVEISLDSTLVAWTFVTTVGCTLICGLVPALSATRNVHERIKEGARGLAAGSGKVRLRTVLLTAQLALAVMLLTGAGLLVRSLSRITMLDLGYNPGNVLSYRVTLPDARYADAAAYDAFFGRLFAQLAQIAGVEDVAASGNVPLNGGSSAGLAIDGQPMPTRLPEVGYQSVSDAYFETLRIPLQAGRAFDARDRDEATPVAIISAGVARRFWGDANPVGARIRLGPDPSEPWSTVVGVVGDIRRGAAGDVMPTVYVSSRQDQWSSNAVLIRTSGEPTSVLPAVRDVMKSIDPMLAIQRPIALTEDRTNMLSDRRVPMQLLSAFGAIALALAGLGMFGTMAYSVATRTREIGLRVALGAQPSEVLGLIVRQGLLIWAAGIALGVVLSVALGRSIASILYETEPTDPATIATVAVILMVVTLLGCVIPARRALSVDPIVALRSQ